MQKKKKILNCAKSRFERFGIKKTTMDEICSDAGISKKTLYQLFKSKEDLFVSLFIRETLRAREYVLKQIKDVMDPLEKIEKLVPIAINYYKKENFLTQVLRDSERIYTPYLKEKYQRQVEEGMIRILVDILKEGMEKGSINKSDPHVTAYCLFKLFQSFTYFRSSSIKGTKKELQALNKFIANGIKKKKT